MSSTTTTITQTPSKHQTLIKSSKPTKRNKTAKKVLLHQSMTPSQEYDFTLFPPEVKVEKNSSLRHSRVKDSVRPPSPSRETLSPRDNHVTGHKAAMAPRLVGQRAPKPFRPSTCLHHMSARNCTPECRDFRLLPETHVPPKAPLPPRLPTPELSDLDEDDLWSCCRASESNASEKSTDNDEDFWTEMGMNL